MWNFLDLIERATFYPEGSAHDKHLKACMEFMQKIGSERLFPNPTTAANVNEAMRVHLRERRTTGAALDFSVVWDQVRAGFHASSGAGAKNVDAALQLLTDSKTARGLMAQARQPFSDRNGREGQAYSVRRPDVDDMSVTVAKLRQEVSESRNTIYQLRKNMEQNKRQRQSNWQGGRRGHDPQSTKQQGPKGVRAPD